MSLRTAALYLCVPFLLWAPWSEAFAVGFSADQMCSPYYAQCGCDQVPNKDGKCEHKDPQGELPHSNVHGCSVGVCKDSTNGHITSGICSGPNKCLGILCDGKPCAGQPEGFSGQPQQSGGEGIGPTTQPTTGGLNPNTGATDIPNPYKDAVNNYGQYNPLTQTGDVPWSQTTPTTPTTAEELNKLFGPDSPQVSPAPSPTETPQQAAERWAGIGENAQILTPSPESPSGLGTQPNKNLDFGGSNSTGFGAPPGGEQASNPWSQFADQVKQSVGKLGSDFIDNIRAAYGENQDTLKFNDEAKLTAYGVCEGLSAGCNAMEGAPTTARSHLDGDGNPTNEIYTLQKYENGEVPYITTASSQDRLGETGVLDKITYTDPVTGETKTLYNVPYQVADTGGRFPDGTSKMDVPLTIPESMYGNNAAINGALGSQPFNNTQVAFAETNGIEPSGYSAGQNNTQLANLVGQSVGNGYGGTSLASLEGGAYPQTGSSNFSGSSNLVQPVELTSGAPWDLPNNTPNIQDLNNLPLPEPIQDPQQNIWNEMVQNAQKTSAENLNSFYDSVSSIFNPTEQNLPLGNDVPPDLSYGGPSNENIFNTSNNALPFEWSPEGNIASAGNDTTGSALDQQNEDLSAFNQERVNFQERVASEMQLSLNQLSDDQSAGSALAQQEEQLSALNQAMDERLANGIPTPLQTETDPQSDIEAVNQAEQNKAIEDSLLNDRLAQADRETAAYEKALLDAEKSIPKPEMVQVTPEQIAQQVKQDIENNIPVPEQVATNPQKEIEYANEPKYTLSNQGDLRGDFLADPVTAALIPDSMKEKLAAAYENGDKTVSFTQSELDSIHWDLANANQAQKLEALLSNARYERTDGFDNPTQPGVQDIAALQQIASDKNGLFAPGLATRDIDLTSGSMPESQPAGGADEFAEGTKSPIERIQEGAAQFRDYAMEEAKSRLDNFLKDNPIYNGLTGGTDTTIDETAKPIENPPLPKDRPTEAGPLGINLASCGGVCEAGNTGPDVKAIQQFLNTQSGNAIPVDGIYGPKTEAAVEAFQKANNIAVDGIAGPQTLAKINEIAAQSPQTSPAPGETQTPSTDVPLPKPRPSEADQTTTAGTQTNDEAAAALAQKAAQQAAAEKSLLKYTNTASVGLSELAKGASGNQAAMAAGAQAAAAMKQQAVTLKDSQLYSLISKYQTYQSQLSQTYQLYQKPGGFAYVGQLITLQAAAVQAGNKAINYVKQNYR